MHASVLAFRGNDLFEKTKFRFNIVTNANLNEVFFASALFNISEVRLF